MTFSHHDIRERLVDYLYGQLDGATRAAFQAHLTSCAACSAEVTGAEHARTVAREVVRRPLGDAVPERVRAHALEAARAAVRPRSRPAQAQGAAAVTSPSPGRADDGWFKRQRRRWTWTFPTFATVAAMAVFLLVRATIFREAKRPVSEETAHQLARPAPEKPEAIRDVDEAPRAAAPGGAQVIEGEAAAPSIADGLTGTGAGSAPRSPAAKGGHPHRQSAVGGLSSLGAPSKGGAAVASSVPVRKERAREPALPDDAAFDDLDTAGPAGRGRARGQDATKDKALDQPRSAARGTSAGAGASAAEAPKAAKKIAPDSFSNADKRDFALPPPPPAAAQPAPVAAAAPAPAKLSAPAQAEREESPASAATASDAQSGKHKANEDSGPVAPFASSADRGAARAAPADPALALASRAEGLMHAHRWNDAVTAYREVLRRYPSHPAAAVWRQRLAAAQAALAADTGQFAAPPPAQR